VAGKAPREEDDAGCETDLNGTRAESTAVTLTAAKAPKSSTIDERASIVRKGAAQFVRLRRELHFPADIEKVSIRRHGGGLFSSPVRPSWSSFFAIQVDVPDDFLELRDD
jgi:antitoxin VapB